MFIRRTILILVGFILCILTFSIGDIKYEKSKKPTVYVSHESDGVVDKIKNNSKIEQVYSELNADIIITNSSDTRDGYRKNNVGYSPVVVFAYDRWVDESSDSLKYYGSDSNKIYKISIADLVEAYNESEDSSWVSEIGFELKKEAEVKVYIPNKESFYRKVVVDSIINSFMERGDTLEYAIEQLNKFTSRCEQEYDVKELVKSCGDSYDKIVIAPEFFMNDSVMPLYDDSSAQDNIFIYNKIELDTEEILDKTIQSTVMHYGMIYGAQYRKTDIEFMDKHSDITGYYQDVANKISKKDPVDYTSKLGDNYWIKSKLKIQE